MERLLQHYQNLLQALVENADQRINELELLSPGEPPLVTPRDLRVDVEAIEATLKQHAGVREVVVVTRELPQRERQLVAYVVGETETPPTAGELRDHVRA